MSVKIAERLQRIRPYGERRIPLGPGVVWFSNPDLGTGLCFPIQRLGYRVKLSGPAGAIEAFLTFINPTTQVQDAYFLFPLDRSVSPVRIRGKAGDQQFEVDVGPAPKDEAEEAKQSSLPPGLCKLFKDETEDVLAIPLGSIPSGGEVSLQMLLAYMVYEVGESGQGFSFRLPLMTSQALMTLDGNDADQLTLATGLDRGAQVAISLQVEASDLRPGMVATSQVCGVARTKTGDLTVEYDRRKPLEPRDFVMDYQLWAGEQPKGWLRSQGRHFLFNFFPPLKPTHSNPRRLVILLDGSEEMSKVGLKRCGGCLSYILKNLEPADKFALVAFNREVSGYKNGDFVEASLADEALNWLSEFHFSGGADLKELLRRVVTLPRQPDSVLSVVLVTAGRIGNEPELYRLLHGSRDILRLFPIMLGHRADPSFARAAARLTGGYAFRALTQESVSRAAERVLEHTRQPVLEGVVFQDKGLGYQGDSLTPKYPTGLNWRRPITVMGAHTGHGGVEAGGTAPNGRPWSEFLELKPCFHKVLANVWAHVKSSELDDEAQMLDRVDRSILLNVIMNLSREFKLLNRHTVPVIRMSTGNVIMGASIEAGRWHRRLQKDLSAAQSANELIEKQKVQKGITGGISKGRDPGRGLKMKDALGSKATAPIFGSKLSAQSKLSPSVKEGLFSKPMFDSKRELPPRPGTLSPRSESTPAPTCGGGRPPAPSAPPPEVARPPAVPAAPSMPPPPPELEAPLSEPMPRASMEPLTDSPLPELPPMESTYRDAPSSSLDITLPEETVPSAPPSPPPVPPSSVRDVSERSTARLGPPRIGQLGSMDFSSDDLSDEFDPHDLPTEKLDVSGFRGGLTSIPAIPRIVQSMPDSSSSGGDFDEHRGKPDLPVPRPNIETRRSAESDSGLDLDDEFGDFGLSTPSAPPAPVREPSVPEPEPDPEPVAPPPVTPEPVVLRRRERAMSGGMPAPVVECPEPTKRLPTPRELASQVRPEARGGKQEDLARRSLREVPEIRKGLMSKMRSLHGALARADAPTLLEMTDAVLFELAEVAPRAELLVRAYGLGFQARELISGDLNEARSKLKFWLTRFAKLF